MTDPYASIIDFYTQNVERYKNDFRAAVWGSKESQEKRFEILSQIGDIPKRTLLDVGCGTGSFYDWLTTRGYALDYTGVDITPATVSVALETHPRVKFRVENILERKTVEADYDYTFASGIFNRKMPDHEAFLKAMIERMFALCRLGVGFNILSAKADHQKVDEYCADPGEIANFCLTLSRRVMLRHDYMPHDFTVYLYK